MTLDLLQGPGPNRAIRSVVFDDAHSQAAQGLDRDFRRACARVQVDEPWFGAFALTEVG